MLDYYYNLGNSITIIDYSLTKWLCSYVYSYLFFPGGVWATPLYVPFFTGPCLPIHTI